MPSDEKKRNALSAGYVSCSQDLSDLLRAKLKDCVTANITKDQLREVAEMVGVVPQPDIIVVVSAPENTAYGITLWSS